jgi:phosphatidylethanolamine/phosphatidyl-N-methylethanolamine N-methyltransferase
MTALRKDLPVEPANEAAMLSKLETKGAESALFFRHWLKHPLEIGAFLPSSAAVGRAMAKAVALDRPGMILELGGGTGPVTASLLEAGCQPERLIVVEREAALAAMLRQRFPRLQIVEGDATAIAEILAERGVTKLAAIVSSLPIKWFPIASQRAVIAPCLDLAGDGGSFVQLTNALVSPVAMSALDLDGYEVARVWSQFPPVQVWRYQRRRGLA